MYIKITPGVHVWITNEQLNFINKYSQRESFRNTDLEATEILLEAHSGAGKNLQVVGEARPGEHVNAATGTVTLEPGETIKVTLKMDPEFEGKFKVKAIDPVTNSTLGNVLELVTDYAV